MDIKSVGRWINRLDIKSAMLLNQVLGARLSKLATQLSEALPSDLRDRFGNSDATTDIVWNGGHSFFLFENVGLTIDDNEKEEYFEKGRQLLQPVIESWARFGVILEKISFTPANNGLIEAHFVLK